MKRILNWIQRKVAPKIVITFSSHGCMGTELKFQHIGYVKKEWKSNSVDYYLVQPFIKRSDELRNAPIKEVIVYQIQHLGYNVYIHYI